MPDIQSPDPGRKLQERYNLIGTTPAPFLSPELVPVVILDDLSESLPGTAFAFAGDNVAGVAAQFSQTSIENIAGSGILITEIRLYLTGVSAGVITAWQNGPTLGISQLGNWADRRNPGRPSARIGWSASAAPATSEQLVSTNLLANTMLFLDFTSQILQSGDKVHVVSEILNSQINAWWTWGEIIA